MAKLYSPAGTEIKGTFERVPGCAGILNEEITQNADGTFDFQYDGGTEMYWDDGGTIMRSGQRVFLDEDGGEWLENQLVLREDDED